MKDVQMDIIWRERKRNIFGMPLSFTVYSLTEERLFIETGLFNSVENEVRLYRILDVQLRRSFMQKIFGIGTIAISSSDKSLGDFVLKNVKKPKVVKELISKNVEIQRELKRVVNREIISGNDVSVDIDGDGIPD
ncbi:PH domain-containing protein [Johnsonella ignava]|uniref:PH domain-containing protein n=1 Tax=Johnsonella ignava TaxID=43995 RepID=UPI0023EF6370|nr:PH domain-containing protein [Johnsonella ignava]